MHVKLRFAGALVALSFTVWAQPSGERRTVVVISLDGFPAFALDDPKLPVPTLRNSPPKAPWPAA